MASQSMPLAMARITKWAYCETRNPVEPLIASLDAIVKSTKTRADFIDQSSDEGLLDTLLRAGDPGLARWGRGMGMVIRRHNLGALGDYLEKSCCNLLDEKGWLVERNASEKFGRLVVGEAWRRNLPAGQLEEICAHFVNNDGVEIGKAICSALYGMVDNKPDFDPANLDVPKENLAWLWGKCPGRALFNAAGAIMMGEENEEYLINPLVQQCQAAHSYREAEAIGKSTPGVFRARQPKRI